MATVLVGSAYSTYDLRIDGLRKAAAEAKDVLRGLERDATSLTRTRPVKLIDGGGARTEAQSLRELSRQATAAIREAEQLERQMRRTTDAEIQAARATGNYARAMDLLERELRSATAGSERYFQIQSRIGQLRKQQVASAPAAQVGTAGGLGATLVRGAGALGVAFGATEIAQTGAELAQLGRQVTTVTNRFNDLARQGGSTGESLLRALRSASGGEIDDLSLRLTANRAAIQGVGDSAEELAPLLAIARDRAQSLGLDTAQAFNDLVEGLGKAQPEILDNLGITLNLTQVYGDYSAQLGKTANELSVAEKRTALLNAVLAQAGNTKPIDPNPYAQLAAEAENARQQLGTLIDQGLLPAAEAATTLLRALNGRGNAGIGDLSNAFGTLTGTLNPIIGLINDYNNGILRALGVQGALTSGLNQLGQALGLTRREETAATDQATTAVNQYVAATPPYIAAQQASHQSTRALTEAERARGAALQQQIIEQQQQQQATIQQQAIDSRLVQLSQQVAAGTLTEADAVRQLTALFPDLAGQAGVIVQQQVRIEQATNAATLALIRQKAATLDLTGGQGLSGANAPGRRGAGDSEITRIANEQRAAKAAAQALADAQRDQSLALATNAQKLAIYRKELAALTPGTVAYIQKQTEIQLLERQIASERASAAGKSEKALAGQQRAVDTSLNQIENRYEDHYRRLTQLQEDYTLRSSRATEDFQDQYRRLLAEGRRFEADQLKRQFERDQRRAAEDFAIQRRRQEQDAGLDVGRIQEKAAIRGVAVPGGTTDSRIAQDAAGRAVPVGGGGGASGGNVLSILLNAQVILDGQAVGRLVAPTVEQELVGNFVQLQITAPPNPPGTAVGGPRP